MMRGGILGRRHGWRLPSLLAALMAVSLRLLTPPASAADADTGRTRSNWSQFGYDDAN